MRVLLEILTPSDRLSIITFSTGGKRICPLRPVTPENIVSFSQHIQELQAGGGTNIISGMKLALKTMDERKIANKVSSVFLLSDGQDSRANELVKE